MTDSGDPLTIKDQTVSSVAEITTALKSLVPRELVGSRNIEETPLMLRFAWNSKESMDMKEISQIWRGLGDQSQLRCEIYFPDPDA
jgi:hypothetical protein